MGIINRPEYLNSLISSKDKQIIKVISGIRRCGKSTIMEIYRDWLLEHGVDAKRIIYINFEEINFEHLNSYRMLYDYITSLLQRDGINYIFLDEIQHVSQFEKAVDSLFNKNPRGRALNLTHNFRY